MLTTLIGLVGSLTWNLCRASLFYWAPSLRAHSRDQEATMTKRLRSLKRNGQVFRKIRNTSNNNKYQDVLERHHGYRLAQAQRDKDQNYKTTAYVLSSNEYENVKDIAKVVDEVTTEGTMGLSFSRVVYYNKTTHLGKSYSEDNFVLLTPARNVAFLNEMANYKHPHILLTGDFKNKDGYVLLGAAMTAPDDDLGRDLVDSSLALDLLCRFRVKHSNKEKVDPQTGKKKCFHHDSKGY